MKKQKMKPQKTLATLTEFDLTELVDVQKKCYPDWSKSSAAQVPSEIDTNPHHFRTGGVLIEKSPCCGAPVTYTTGGIMMKICSKCGGPIKPTFLR